MVVDGVVTAGGGVAVVGSGGRQKGWVCHSVGNPICARVIAGASAGNWLVISFRNRPRQSASGRTR